MTTHDNLNAAKGGDEKEPSEKPPGQGGKRREEVLIGLSLATVYDLALARRHLENIREAATTSMILPSEAVMALDFILSTVDTVGAAITLVRKERRQNGPQVR